MNQVVFQGFGDGLGSEEENIALGSLFGVGCLQPHGSLPAPSSHACTLYESELGSRSTLEFWKNRYFSRLEEDEKLAVPICSLFFEVRSVRFRDSLNISVYKISTDCLEWNCGAHPGRGFCLHFFAVRARCLSIAGFTCSQT